MQTGVEVHRLHMPGRSKNKESKSKNDESESKKKEPESKDNKSKSKNKSKPKNDKSKPKNRDDLGKSCVANRPCCRTCRNGKSKTCKSRKIEERCRANLFPDFTALSEELRGDGRHCCWTLARVLRDAGRIVVGEWEADVKGSLSDMVSAALDVVHGCVMYVGSLGVSAYDAVVSKVSGARARVSAAVSRGRAKLGKAKDPKKKTDKPPKSAEKQGKKDDKKDSKKDVKKDSKKDVKKDSKNDDKKGSKKDDKKDSKRDSKKDKK